MRCQPDLDSLGDTACLGKMHIGRNHIKFCNIQEATVPAFQLDKEEVMVDRNHQSRPPQPTGGSNGQESTTT